MRIAVIADVHGNAAALEAALSRLRQQYDPGSVGSPAYHDATEPTRVSESGSPRACFALVTVAAEIKVELHAIAYDWERAAREAERNGRQDRAHAQRIGTPVRGTGASA